MPAVSVKPVG
jgi:hypothetical protein